MAQPDDPPIEPTGPGAPPSEELLLHEALMNDDMLHRELLQAGLGRDDPLRDDLLEEDLLEAALAETLDNLRATRSHATQLAEETQALVPVETAPAPGPSLRDPRLTDV